MSPDVSDFGFGVSDPEGLTADAEGQSPDGPPPAEDAVVERMRSVHDPEIPVNIYDLGLIYDIDIGDDGHVGVIMTLTAPGCPVAGEMPKQVADAIAEEAGVKSARVALTFEPAWSPAKMSEDARLALGFDF